MNDTEGIPAPIGVDEWLSAQERIESEKQEEGMTAEEIGAALKRPRTADWVRKQLLKPLKAAGRIKIGQALREAINGREKMTTVYRILPPPRKQNAKR